MMKKFYFYEMMVADENTKAKWQSFLSDMNKFRGKVTKMAPSHPRTCPWSFQGRFKKFSTPPSTVDWCPEFRSAYYLIIISCTIYLLILRTKYIESVYPWTKGILSACPDIYPFGNHFRFKRRQISSPQSWKWPSSDDEEPRHIANYRYLLMKSRIVVW